MASRQCTKCGEYKYDEDFNWRITGVMRQSVCRECSAIQRREHYESHTEAEKERTRDRKKQAREEARYFVFDYLSHSVCKECGEYRPEMLQFHHVGRKTMDISAMASHGYSIDAIRKEITQCIVLCASCHQMLEHKKRKGY